MFTKPIFKTTLTGEIADRLFSNITATGTSDSSFLATMRVLLHKRISDDKQVHLICKPLHYSANDISYATHSEAMNWFVPGETQYAIDGEHNIIIVHTTNQDAGAKMLEIVRANVKPGKRHMSNYALQEDLRIFYARKLNALFYHNESENKTIIFTDKLDSKQFHALQMMLPKYLPNLFKDKPLTESETNLLKSLGNKSAVEYERFIEEFAKDLDIRSEIIRTKLAGFETAFECQRIEELKNEIKLFESNYESYLANLRQTAEKIQERQYTLAGLECAIKNHGDESELMSYFMCNKNLSIINVSGTGIEFVAHGYADIFDEEAFDKFVKNHNGYMYAKLSPRVSKPQMEKLYRAIFGGENKYKLRICAAYNADMKSGLSAIKHYTFPPESETYLENTHIQQFGCIGSYAARFQEFMRKKDYVGAISQAVISARNLNFYDSVVISTFASQLSCTSKTCIEKTDGTLITPYDAILELEGGVEQCQDQ